jgi:phage/plasmid-associated DNA primase
MDKSYVVFDECEKAGYGFKLADMLKNLITEKTINIHEKGKNLIEVNSYLNCVFLSNHEKIVKIDKDNRRFACFEVSDKYANDFDYFEKFNELMEDDEAIQSFVNYLYRLKSDVNIKRIPKTQLAEDMTDIDVIDEFINDIEYGEDYKYFVHTDKNKNKTIKFTIGQAFSSFCNFAEKSRLRNDYNRKIFGKELLQKREFKDVRKSNGRFYIKKLNN